MEEKIVTGKNPQKASSQAAIAAARIVTEGAWYKHYKGDLYQVIKIAYTTEGKTLNRPEDIDDSVKLVVYKKGTPSSLGDNVWWVRPYTMFIENVLIDGKEQPRFVECQQASDGKPEKKSPSSTLKSKKRK